jgi:aspartyl-tRNA(Asn)/glutamyl-tRNA(Gln) amidotransferase subunit C
MAKETSGKPSFTIDADMVKYVAYLVRLGIKEEEARAFSQQFTAIIDYFDLLNEVNTDQVIPACELSNLRSILREDEARPSMSREDFLKNAPHHDGKFIQVPLVFEEE